MSTTSTSTAPTPATPAADTEPALAALLRLPPWPAPDHTAAHRALLRHRDQLDPQVAQVAQLRLAIPAANISRLAAAAGLTPTQVQAYLGWLRQVAAGGTRRKTTPVYPGDAVSEPAAEEPKRRPLPPRADAPGPYGLVKTRPVRLHLRRLRRYYTYREIAALVGLADPNTVGDLEAGTRRWTYRRTAEAILAVPIPPDRMPRYELVPNPHRRPLRGRRRWREAIWDWVKVNRAVAGQMTRDLLTDVEEERAVRQMAAAGMSAGEIGRRLRWCGPGATAKQEEDAIGHFLTRNNIPSGRPQGTRRLGSRARSWAAA